MGDPEFGGVKNWLDKVVRDHRNPDSPNYIEALAVTTIGWNNPLTFARPQLDTIKDYLSQFDYLIVGSTDAKQVASNRDIWDPVTRSKHINATIFLAGELLKYLRDNNITVPKINYYIEWEANLNGFLPPVSQNATLIGWKNYIPEVTKQLTELNIENNMTEPDFYWSPYWGTEYNNLSHSAKALLTAGIKNFLQSVPGLWIDIQDGVGIKATKHADGTIDYGRTAENAINYHDNILKPAASGTNLKDNRVNMECFVFDDHHPHGMPPGDPSEQAFRIYKYTQANVPLGMSFEIRYWCGSLYYVAVPHVIGMGVSVANQVIHQARLNPVVTGPTSNATVVQQDPPATVYPDVLTWVPYDTNVNITTAGPVQVPNVSNKSRQVAKNAIENAGLNANFVGSGTYVDYTDPDGGTLVPWGKTVTIYMASDQFP